ncbi:MAG: hypothetical protein KatS3mg090_0638 [Patescibacteria group bacterium]|nr:MAG: hypothetical protein KatS3mg090_0638 [Patescibacteria group bacterium]
MYAINQTDLINNLLQEGLDARLLENARLESLKKDIPFDDYLLTNTDIDKKKIYSAIAKTMGTTYVDLDEMASDPQALAFVPEIIARKYDLLPVKYNQSLDEIVTAVVDPLNLSLKDFLEKKTGKKIRFVLAEKDKIKSKIDMSYSQRISPEVLAALKEVEGESVDSTVQKKIETVNREAPIARIVNTILEFAVKSRASDVHIEPLEDRTRVRYRIDGILTEKLVLPRSIHSALVSRIKILSDMKIDEKRVPQDGRFAFSLGSEEVDLRVSTLPSVHGEKVVMRLLKKTGGIPDLPALGWRGPQLKLVEEAIRKPYGIILVTGPTGSGKTTTLYSVLNRLNKPTVNIVTLEDPVEYQIPGITQVQVNPQAGLTFANGLRAFLRQDPDIILVGEIRDKETTQLAIQAALTGHLVFSTLHTNDSATAIPRLLDLGAEPFLVASVLEISIAQRIVRRVCEDCKEEYEPKQEIIDNIKTVLGDLLPKKYQDGTEKIKLTRGKGCKECGDTGYRGRIGIFEVLKVTPEVTNLILNHSASEDIMKVAKSQGMMEMIQDGYLKALDGLTTIEEVLRVSEA